MSLFYETQHSADTDMMGSRVFYSRMSRSSQVEGKVEALTAVFANCLEKQKRVQYFDILNMLQRVCGLCCCGLTDVLMQNHNSGCLPELAYSQRSIQRFK